jgi:hypothetical protein
MKIDGIELDTIADFLSNGYIQPYVPLSTTAIPGDPNSKAGWCWEGKVVPYEEADAAFWAKVEKKYPTIRVTGKQLKQTLSVFEGLMEAIIDGEISKN